MIDNILRAWELAADPAFGGSLDGWECEIDDEAPPPPVYERQVSRYQGVVWRVFRGKAYWMAQPYVAGVGKRYGVTLPATHENERRCAEDAARLAEWDAPRMRADNARSWRNAGGRDVHD